MQNIIRLFRVLGGHSRFLPLIFTAIFLITSFAFDWITLGFTQALVTLGKTLLSAELIINENVHKAILNEGYGLIQFIEILISIYILYEFTSFWARMMVKVSGSQAIVGAYFIGLIVVFIIEVAFVKIIDGHFGFIPLWNGIIFLLFNLQPVLTNIITFPTAQAVFILGRKFYKQH